MRRGQQFNCWDQDDLLRWKFVFGKPMQFWCTRFSGRLRHPLFQLLALLTPMFRGLCPDIAPGVVPRHCSRGCAQTLFRGLCPDIVPGVVPRHCSGGCAQTLFRGLCPDIVLGVVPTNVPGVVPRHCSGGCAQALFRGLCPDIAPGVVPRHCSGGCTQSQARLLVQIMILYMYLVRLPKDPLKALEVTSFVCKRTCCFSTKICQNVHVVFFCMKRVV